MFRSLTAIAIAGMLIGACWNMGSAAKIYTKAWFAQVLLERAWNKTLQGQDAARPWPWADTWPVAELSSPKSRESLIVLSGDNGRALAFGPGHSEAGMMPGQQGVTIISGHRDTHFKFLKNIELNDVFEVKTPEATFDYTVVEHGVVDQRFFSPSVSVSGEYLMLVTCYPFDALTSGGDLRYIVVAERIPFEIH